MIGPNFLALSAVALPPIKTSAAAKNGCENATLAPLTSQPLAGLKSSGSSQTSDQPNLDRPLLGSSFFSMTSDSSSGYLSPLTGSELQGFPALTLICRSPLGQEPTATKANQPQKAATLTLQPQSPASNDDGGDDGDWVIVGRATK
jgi:hypothetical protein